MGLPMFRLAWQEASGNLMTQFKTIYEPSIQSKVLSNSVKVSQARFPELQGLSALYHPATYSTGDQKLRIEGGGRETEKVKRARVRKRRPSNFLLSCAKAPEFQVEVLCGIATRVAFQRTCKGHNTRVHERPLRMRRT